MRMEINRIMKSNKSVKRDTCTILGLVIMLLVVFEGVLSVWTAHCPAPFKLIGSLIGTVFPIYIFAIL